MRNRFSFGMITAITLTFLVLVVVSNRPSEAAEDNKAETKKDSAAGYNLVAPLSAIMEVMDNSIFSKIPDKAKAGKFKDIKREGLFLAEIANLTAQDKEYRNNKEWVSVCEKWKEAALKLSEAADKKDAAAVMTQHAAVEKTCEMCHEKFRDN